jgi:hypothetical protein
MKAYGGVDVQIPIFLTSALAGGEWSGSDPRRFTTRERAPGIHWVGPRAGVDDVEKILDPIGIRTPTPLSSSPQPVYIPTALSCLPRTSSLRINYISKKMVCQWETHCLRW